MPIIVEGCDASGKTTLIKWLLADHPELRLHDKFVSSDMGGRETMIERVIPDCGRAQPDWVYDRHPFISEPIMSTALSREIAPGFNHPAIRSIRTAFLAKSLVILCMPAWETVAARLSGHNAENQPSEVRWNARGIYTGYESLIMTYHPIHQLFVYRYDSLVSDEILEDLIDAYLRKGHA